MKIFELNLVKIIICQGLNIPTSKFHLNLDMMHGCLCRVRQGLSQGCDIRSVPIMLSHIFFSMCITSRLCHRSKSFQYSKSHKVDLRVNNNLSSALPRFLFPLPLSGWFPSVICLAFSNSTCNSQAVSLFGASRFSCFALNTCLRYFLGCDLSLARKRRCLM